MRISDFENAIVKILLSVGLILSAGFLILNIVRLVDNHGAARLLREEVVAFRDISDASGALSGTRDDLTRRIDELERFLYIPEAAQRKFLNELVGAGGAVHAWVRIGDLEYGTEADGHASSPLTITVRGSYPEVVAYLSTLENSPYFVYLDSMAFERVGGSDEIQGEIDGHIFRNGL